VVSAVLYRATLPRSRCHISEKIDSRRGAVGRPRRGGGEEVLDQQRRKTRAMALFRDRPRSHPSPRRCCPPQPAQRTMPLAAANLRQELLRRIVPVFVQDAQQADADPVIQPPATPCEPTPLSARRAGDLLSSSSAV